MTSINLQTAARKIRDIKAKNAIEKVLQKQLMKRNGGFCFSDHSSSEIRPIRADISSLLRCNRPRISISYSLPTLHSFQTKFPLAITSHSLSLLTFRFSTFLPSHSHNPAKRAPCSVSFTIVSNFSTLHSTTALSSPDTVPNFGFSRPKREC